MGTGIQLVISMCIHMAAEVVFLNECFPTFIAAVIEFSPDRSLVVTHTQPRLTSGLPGTEATNKAFFMSDFHVFSELKIVRELSRALFT